MLRFISTAVVGWTVLACLAPTVTCGQDPAKPDYAMPIMLVRNTIGLVNHGNLTGNYTVLRDLASERLRQRNTASDLAATFANLRLQKLDLSPTLVIEPQFIEPPREIAPGRLLLVGQFPTQPRAVRFALVFQQVAAGWMIDEISIDVAQPQSATTTAPVAELPLVAPPQPAQYPNTASNCRAAAIDHPVAPLPAAMR